MKTIGLLGGMSWQSTTSYYREINEGVQAALGGLHSADLLMASVDFAPLEEMQAAGNWQAAGELLADAAARLERAGAEGLLICTNTMHKVAPQIEDAITIPLLHIADATGELLREQKRQRVALLGTAFTMEHDFYKHRLIDRFEIDVLVPNEQDRNVVHNIIYRELCVGEIKDQSRTQYLAIIDRLLARGAEAVILGCTEIGLLVKSADTVAPLIDTASVHADKAVSFMLRG